MIEKMSNYILDNVLYKDENVTGDQREIMNFGITRILEDVPKYIAILLISIVLNILPQIGIVLAVTIAYKSFTGGTHARDNITCFISSTIIFLAPVLIPKYIILPSVVTNIIYVLVIVSTIYVIAKIVPADTEEIPILKKKKRTQLKILATISSILILLSCMFIIKDKYTINIILLTLLSINLMTTNPAYKLFKCKHSYESDEYKEYFNK